MFDIISIGTLNLDTVLRIGKYPKRGGNTFIKSFERYIGGPAANFAICASKFGLRTCLLSKIGTDAAGEFLMKGLSEYKLLDITKLILDKQRKTSLVFSVVDEGGERTFFAFFEDSAIACFKEEEVDPNLIATSRLLFSDGAVFFLKEARHALLRAMEIAKEKKIKVLFDPNVRIEYTLPADQKKAYISAIKLTDILCLGEEEAFLLTRKSTAEAATEDLLALGPEIICLKLGPRGSMVVSQNESFYAPSFDIECVDATGAGDVYDAGVAYGYLKGLPLKQVAVFANAVGALKVSRFGASSSPSLKEVLNFLQQHHKKLTKGGKFNIIELIELLKQE